MFPQHLQNTAGFLNRCARGVADVKSTLKHRTLQEKNLHGRMLPGGPVLRVRLLPEQSRMCPFGVSILLEGHVV